MCVGTWSNWLETGTGITVISARQYTDMAKLVKKYPKLGNLRISFTSMRDMKAKIKTTFEENPQIAKYWKKI